jgi:DNA-directed RNA polymerase specialized sigma24 family protein
MARTVRDPSLATSDAPLSDEDRSLSDEDGPLSVRGAALNRNDPPLDESEPPLDASVPPLDARDEAPRAVAAVFVDNRESFKVSDSPTDERGPGSHVSPTALRTYLALPETQKHVDMLVKRFLGDRAPKDVREDIRQQAYMAALTAKSPPRSAKTMPGWLAMVTRRAVFRSFKSGAGDLKWLDREADVDEQAGEPVEAPGDRWLISDWLTTHLTDERDQETYEMIVEKARTGATDQAIADAHGITYAAWTHRLSAFKKKYAPQWQRRQMLIVLLWGGLALVVAALVWLLARMLMQPVEPEQHVPVAPVAPSASVVPTPPPPPTEAPWEPALPTQTPRKL